MVLGWVDICVCLATLVASALIGVYFACRSQGGSSEYLRGGQTMHVLPVSLSLIASFVSGVTLLGVPSEMYLYGTQFATSLFAFCLMGFTLATVFVPVFRDLKLESCYQYLELRFDLRVRRTASFMFIISQVLFIPIVIYVPALALSQVTGIGVHVATLVTSVVCIFYTTIGGLRAVVWTDALQTVLMVGATIAVLVLGVQKVGGLDRVWELCSQGQRIQSPDLDPSPLRRYTFWTVLVGAYVFYVAQCGVGSGYVQRYIAVTTPRDARWTVVWFTIGLLFLVAMSLLMGLVAFAAYHDCDPITSQRVSHVDQLVPVFLLDVAGNVPGLPGLFVAGVFSAALSSMSTGINSVCGVLVEDVLAGRLPSVLSRDAWLRVFAVLTGVLCVALVLVVERLGGVLQATISMLGVTSGSLLGLFLLGLFCPRATPRAAFVGAVFSLVTTGTLVFATQVAVWRGQLVHPTLPLSVAGCPENVTVAIKPPPVDVDEVFPLLRISHMYYSLLGSTLTLLVALPVALLMPDKDKVAVLPRAELLHPLARRLLPSVRTREAVPLVHLSKPAR